MSNKNYVLGFIIGLIAALVYVIDLSLIIYFNPTQLIYRIILAIVPFVVNIILFACKDYFSWFFRRMIFWVFLIIFAVIAIYMLSILKLTQENDIIKQITNTEFDYAQLQTFKTTVRSIVYCVVSHILGGFTSLIIVAIKKSIANKHNAKIISQKRLLLRAKNRKKQKNTT